jgi:hypothetical protein
MFCKADMEIIYKNYKPDGKWDTAGRWYPSDFEKCDCCNGLRSPSRAFPKSLWKHCHTKKHITKRLAQTSDLMLINYKKMVLRERIKELVPDIPMTFDLALLVQEMLHHYDFENGMSEKFKEALWPHIIDYLI